jgi:hypothetical protein
LRDRDSSKISASFRASDQVCDNSDNRVESVSHYC